MAEVQEATPSSEPSMEEILASIRRIISDDEQPPAAVSPSAPADDEVIELTQEVKDDGTVVDLTKAEEPALPPEPLIQSAPTPLPPPPPPVMEPPPKIEPVKALELEPGEPLISKPKADVAAYALSSLANTVEIERLAHEPRTMSFIGNGTRTLEDMTLELMRPLLKEWLDQNLPATVERLVQKEIERISRKSKE